ncbi:GGDEF domain-containing protein (plasmid) [Photobacterium sp. DA100]|uniref:GGDEF domain-containing protein n=1 Tax=Photobacterium sp. DA100 TaxID=3027472 RepID=UPI002478AB36|nr:GGDEF domain-containing protein [Photobacterium sp. DA100]WEM45119.1 GGDEF domain-containing protein [Photobacterium sp. DA100]
MVKALSTAVFIGLIFHLPIIKVDSPFFYSKAGFVVEYLSLTIITAIAICAYPVLKKEKLFLFGMMLLGLEKAYGMLHEIIALKKTLESIPVPVAIFLDDGCALIGVGCLALGVKQTIDHYESSQSTDELTGVYNRKALRKIPLKQFDLVFFDIDNFKQLNDEHGHNFGDSILKLFSQGLKQYTQQDEIIIRFGGDEFIVILQSHRAKSFLVDIEATISALNISYSYGIAENFNRRNLREAINRSDKALYRMKHLKHQQKYSSVLNPN